MSLVKPDIVTNPSILELQIGLNKIAAGILRMPRDILPWSIAMPCDKVTETYKELRLFEHFWGVPYNLLEGTGVGIGMPPVPSEPIPCDDGLALKCHRARRRKSIRGHIEEEANLQRELELQALEKNRLEKLLLKKKRRKEEEYQRYLKLKKVKYMAHLNTKEKKRRSMLRDLLKKRGKEFDEKPFEDFVAEAEENYEIKLAVKLKEREEKDLKKQLQLEKQEETREFRASKFGFDQQATKVEEESIEDLMKLLHGQGRVEEDDEEDQEDKDVVPAELLSDASTDVSSISTILTPEDVSDEQSIEEDNVENVVIDSFIMPPDPDIKKVKDILGETSVPEISDIDSILVSTLSEGMCFKSLIIVINYIHIT